MNTRLYIKNSNLAKPWRYFLAVYFCTWSLFGVTYRMGLNGESSAMGAVLVFLALSAPSVIAIIFVYLSLNQKGQQDYWQRIIDYKRISFGWYCIILLTVPAISTLAAFLNGYWSSSSFFCNRLPSIGLLILIILLVPILEELGWRGYILDRLQEKYSALTSSLILGVMWYFWHFPAFFLPGSLFSVMPIGSITFWLFTVNLIALSVCFSWIYNNTNRSTLGAILFHMSIEFSADGGLIPYDQPLHFYNITLWMIVVAVIILIFGAKTLTQDWRTGRSTRTSC